MLEKIKVLQQRYSSLHVMGFQYINPTCSDAVRIRLVEIIMKEYITFPILLSKKSFSELTDGACYIIFKDGKGPLCYHKRHTDLKVIDKAIKELNLQEHNENPKLVNNVKSSWVKPIEVMKEPYISLDLRNLLLYFPGCISVDETGNRLFLSDTNHHRIIVFDSNGKILDCIGSTPGFEDGEFETAKLVRPAASFYHATEGCLYFVDSENHAIRKADIERRVLETVYPISTSDTKNNSLWSLWSWIMDNLWMTRNDVDKKSEDLDSESFLFPWHAIKSSDNDLFILNRSFETLWIMDLASGVVKQVIKGFPKILEICGQAIQEKLSLLKQMPHDWLQCQVDANCSVEGIPYAGLISSVATFQDHTVICDTVCQTIYKVSRKSGLISSFQFSNFGVLGLPYWLSFHLENVYFVGNAVSRAEFDHIQSFSLLPGRIDIQLNIDICDDTELAEPLQEDCVWCQARGAATEVSEAENRMSSSENVSSSTMSSSEKVGVAQQWYDELDNIAFSTTEINLSPEEKRTATDGKTQEGRICINCVVNASPGTSEVIISAALYLKMKRKNPNSESQEEKMQRLSNILNMRKSRRMGRDDQCIQYLLKGGNRDLEEYIFTRPLHVSLKINCRNYPKEKNSKDYILTNSSIVVDVALK